MNDQQQTGGSEDATGHGSEAVGGDRGPDPENVSTAEATGGATDAAIGARGGADPVMLPDAAADGAEGDDIDDAPSGGTTRR